MQIKEVLGKPIALDRYVSGLESSLRKRLTKEFNIATIGEAALQQVDRNGARAYLSGAKKTAELISIHPTRRTGFVRIKGVSTLMEPTTPRSKVDTTFTEQVDAIVDQLRGLWAGQKRTMSLVDGSHVSLKMEGDKVRLDVSLDVEDPTAVYQAA